MTSYDYLIFDIETAPLSWDSFAQSQQEYLLRGAETEEQIKKKKYEMALSPMTSQVICIGLQLMSYQDDEWVIGKKATFSVNPDLEEGETVKKEIDEKTNYYFSSEEKIVEDFWNILKKYNRSSLISFNGRNFDAPFLILRSGLLKIRPSRNIMSGTKFNYRNHFDLADELSFYSSGRYGASRKFNFDFYARAFGIDSPKADGVDGSNVHQLYENKEYDIIAEYCLRDVKATWELFLIWDKYLRF